MSRELKFRAWDKKRGEWYGESSESSLTYVGFHLWGECTLLCPPSIEDIQHLEVMQYTGLTDANGVEIYEGDILKSSIEHRDTGVVEWGVDRWRWKPGLNWGEIDVDLWGIEVIGNICEHGHLLNGGNSEGR